MFACKNPIGGSVLNILLFGAANFCVGEIGIGVGKIILCFCFLTTVIMIDGFVNVQLKQFKVADIVNLLFQLFYLIYTAINGYRTIIAYESNSEIDRIVNLV